MTPSTHPVNGQRPQASDEPRSDCADAPACGILNVDKPAGLTSHDVVAAVRKLYRQRRVGHAGTLDPLATGVLLVCLGNATRISEYLMASCKTYRAAVHLGISTTTDDAEGEILQEQTVRVSRKEIEIALRLFLGEIDQVPPVYSAVKQKGRRLYELARKGIPAQVPARKVHVHSLQTIEWSPPILHIQVECGPGTYIRAIARDLGQTLGCGAHLASLRRTRSGRFTADQALSLQQLRTAVARGLGTELLIPLDAALSDMPAVRLGAEAARRLAMGQAVASGDDEGDAGSLARAYTLSGQFIAVVFRDVKTGAWRPKKVFVEPENLPAAT